MIVITSLAFIYNEEQLTIGSSSQTNILGTILLFTNNPLPLSFVWRISTGQCPHN